MSKVNQRQDGGYIINEYKNGTIEKMLIMDNPSLDTQPPSIEEEILFETKYQTLLLEMGGM